MIMYYCDDCGEEIEDKKDIYYISFFSEKDEKFLDNEKVLLCPDCFKSFKDRYLYEE